MAVAAAAAAAAAVYQAGYLWIFVLEFFFDPTPAYFQPLFPE